MGANESIFELSGFKTHTDTNIIEGRRVINVRDGDKRIHLRF